MGNYGYLSAKPHAVTRVDNTDYLITSTSQQITYDPYGKAALIVEGDSSQVLFYGPDKTRWLQATDHYYLLTDNVGSVTHVVNGEGGTMFDAGYEAWGRQHVTKNDIGFFRGYGGHEMLSKYRLVNMDGRLYDYALGRFLSPDNYVQELGNSQNFNRYSYCLNNPLKYTDPDGESFLSAVIIGTIAGAYIGGAIANESYNPTKWSFSSATTWRYLFYGGLVGAISGYVGASVASTGFAGANTVSIMAASLINSLGMNAYTSGLTPIIISAGVLAYDFTNKKFGYLGKKGNSLLENFGYFIGSLANIRDVNRLFDATTANLYTQTFEEGNPNTKDYISHSAIVSKEGDNMISYI